MKGTRMHQRRLVRFGAVALVLASACGKPDSSSHVVDSAPAPNGASVAAAGSITLDSIALGSTLGEWKATRAPDSLIVLDVGIQMQEEVEENLPFVQPLCAEATRVLKT